MSIICIWSNAAQAQSIQLLNASQAALLAHAKPDSGKTIVINLWATWCGPCVREMPYFIQADTSLKGENFEFNFISFDPKDHQSKVEKIIAKNVIPGKHFLITDYDMASLLNMVHPKWEGGIPFTLVLTHNSIRYHEGAFENFRQFWQFIHE